MMVQISLRKQKYDAKIRAYVYEDQPQVKHLAEVSESGKVDDVATGKNYIFNNYDLIARVEKTITTTLAEKYQRKYGWITNLQNMFPEDTKSCQITMPRMQVEK